MNGQEGIKGESISGSTSGVDEQLSDLIEAPSAMNPPTEDATNKPSDDEERDRSSRRAFLGKTARKLAYAAPVMLLFKPKQAVAASQGGSLITPGP